MKRAAGLAAMAVLCLAGPVAASAPATGAAAAATSRPLSSVVLSSPGASYSVLSQGPLNASNFARSDPDPTAASTALGELSANRTIATYERVWRDAGGNNEVQILLVRFLNTSTAHTYFTSVRQALKSGEIVSSGALPGVVGAFRTTYFATMGTQIGVGQAITADAGTTVATLSFFSSNVSSDVHPISLAGARSITRRQLAALTAAPAPTKAAAASGSSATSPDLYWIIGGVLGALLVIAGVALAVLGRRKSSVAAVEYVPVEPRVGKQDIPVLIGLLAAWLFRPRSRP